MQIHETLAESAQTWPDRIALIDAQGALTYAELWRSVEATGKRLHQLGLGAGQGLGLMARNGRGFVIGAFAAVSCGATVMPIWKDLSRAEVDEMLLEAPVHAVLDDGCGPALPPGKSGGVVAPGDAPLRFTVTGLDPDRSFAPHVPEAAFVRFTSGTTGAAKGVVLSHQNLLERTAAAGRAMRITPEDAILWVLPMAFHFFVSIVTYLRFGATIAVCADHHADTILDAAQRHSGTLLYAAPLNYSLLAADGSTRRFRVLSRAISTAVGLGRHTAQAFLDRYGIPVSQAYGIIEVGLPMINLDCPGQRPESVGCPEPEFQVAILDENLKPLAPGEVGELALRGPGMFAAYLNPPQMREEVLRDGWFLTGDLAVQDADAYVTIRGRKKAVINIAGHKVFAEEIEEALKAHPWVAGARVQSRPHPLLGEVIHADVVLADGAATVSVEQLQAYCRQRLSRLKTPHTISMVERLEETATGKVRVA